ncbi:ArsR/SmtB family transcription factor [Nocardia sp. NPDC058519]|uniref:ArsR/SmtB family transcription factor n=1 Tax=Nocardia sp. NPDC058519 TaxID=3346535 RepID=UPI00364CAA18
MIPQRDTGDAALSEQQLHDLAATFGMLAATSRLQIVWLLTHGERDVGTLATEIGQSVAVVSQHLAKLKLAGLVNARKEGRRQVYLLADPGVAAIVGFAAATMLDVPEQTQRRTDDRTA